MNNFPPLTPAFLLLVGCTAAPKLEDYPRREIDRPFSLPQGLATWSTYGMYSRAKYGNDLTDTNVIGAIPVLWRTSLNDRWSLFWAPIPVGATYQFHSNEHSVTGLNLGYGLGISSNGYSTIGPLTGYYHREKLTSDFALEVSPTLQTWIPVGDRARWGFTAKLPVSALWQASNRLALRAGGGPHLRRDPRLVISGSVFDESFDIRMEYDWRLTFPLEGGFTWSFARQWDLAMSAYLQKIGEDRFREHGFLYLLTHYW